MSVKNDIEELINHNIISSESAEKIMTYYAKKEGQNTNRLQLIFGSFGAILVGLGIILILAHNWDTLAKSIKLIIAFIPLVLGQGLSLFALLKKPTKVLWKEASSIFVFFGIGISISLISQIYHISGNFPFFILTWMLLALPFVYILRSSIVSIFYIIGVTYYAIEIGYFSLPKENPYLYILLIATIFPNYIHLINHYKGSNILNSHHWIIAFSLIIVFGSFSNDAIIYIPVGYISLFGLLYLIGHTSIFKRTKLSNNAYKVIGSLGSIIILLLLSFDWYWKELQNDEILWKFNSIEFITASFTTILAIILLVYQVSKNSIRAIKPISIVFLVFLIIFLLGTGGFPGHILINLLIFGIGIMTIAEGAKQDHLGILNYGLTIITTLIICRFFDIHISFIIRGLLFVFVGIGFFLTNSWMIKNRKNDD